LIAQPAILGNGMSPASHRVIVFLFMPKSFAKSVWVMPRLSRIFRNSARVNGRRLLVEEIPRQRGRSRVAPAPTSRGAGTSGLCRALRAAQPRKPLEQQYKVARSWNQLGLVGAAPRRRASGVG